MHQTSDLNIAGSSPVAYCAGSSPVMANHFAIVMLFSMVIVVVMVKCQEVSEAVSVHT